jgi:hypothetical protein
MMMKSDQTPASASDLELRWRLRQLPREREVPTSVLAAIEARLDAAPQNAFETPAVQTAKPWRMWAIAASFTAMAFIGSALWLNRTEVKVVDPQAQMMANQVNLMTLEYQAALKELDQAGSAMMVTNADAQAEAELKLLDDSVMQIRHAISQNPRATYLLSMLRRTYMQRLQITQHLIIVS